MGLTASQRSIARQIIREGRRAGASRKQIKAALAAGQVESNLTNTKGGDRDSVGVFQIRSGIHGPIGGSVRKSAQWFFKNAKSADKGQSSGQLAQDVERSAYPDKYGKPDIQRTAGKLLRAGGVGKGGGGGRKGGTRTIPGTDNSMARKQAILQYFNTGRQDIVGLSQSLKASPDTPSRTITTRHGGSKGGSKDRGGNSGAGLDTFKGAKVTKNLAAELRYARAHGWKGQVTSGYRSPADQRRVCATGVKPCAPPGKSKHQDKHFGAADVTDAETLSRILRRKGSRYKWAGSKDPVHFSVPSGGSY